MSAEVIETIEDEIDVNLFIGRLEDPTAQFDVVEMEVEHTKYNMANYASGVVVPAQDNDGGENITSAQIRALSGQPAFLYARTSIQVGAVQENKDNALIFKGNVANIVATGEGNLISILLFDRSQESFSYSEDGENPKNFINNSIDFSNIEGEISEVFGVREDQQSLPAADIVETILTDPQFGLAFEEGEVFILGEDERFGENEFAPSPFGDGGGAEGSGVNLYEVDYIIELKDESTVQTDDVLQATNLPVNFQETDITVYNIFSKIREKTAAEFWFDRFGVFHFGAPRPTKHELQFITDTTAGLTTPPYQGVKVISRPTRSSELADEDDEITVNDLNRRNRSGAFVVEASIARQDVRETIRRSQGETEEGAIVGSEKVVVFHDSDDTVVAKPQFEYVDYSLVTQTQVLNAAKSFLKDIIDQSADGEITVLGFPEVELFDGIKMPDTSVQPMGGSEFSVTKIVHEISSDGFLTRLSVGGVLTPPDELSGEFDTVSLGNFQVTNQLPPASTDTEDAALFDPRLNAAAGLDPYTDIRSYNPEGAAEVAAPGQRPGDRGSGGGFGGLLQSIVSAFNAAVSGGEDADPRLQSTLETDPVEDTGFVNESNVFDRPPRTDEIDPRLQSTLETDPVEDTGLRDPRDAPRVNESNVLEYIQENFGDTEINVDDDDDDGRRRPNR
jgi:hypothetical protein